MNGMSHRENLEHLAAGQWGMFTTGQAQSLGIQRNQCIRYLESGRVSRVRYGVYAFNSARNAEHEDIKAAWLSVYPKLTAQQRLGGGSPDAVVAGRTAATLLGCGDFYASPYTLIVRDRKQTNQDDLIYLQRSLNDADVAYVDGLPVTRPERIVADLIRADEDPDLVGAFMADVVQSSSHRLDEQRLASLLAPLAHRNGFGKGDGAGFARELLGRYVDQIRIESSVETLASIVDAMPDNLLRLAAKLTPDIRRLAREPNMTLAGATVAASWPEGLSSLPEGASQASFLSAPTPDTQEPLSELPCDEDALAALRSMSLPTPKELEKLNQILAQLNGINEFLGLIGHA